MYKGLLIKESLKDKKVLNLTTITKTEIWDAENASILQPKKWTAIYFEGEDKNLDSFLDKLSKSLKPKAWFANITQEKTEFVVFPNKIFKYVSGDDKNKIEAQNFARSLEVPESQLNW